MNNLPRVNTSDLLNRFEPQSWDYRPSMLWIGLWTINHIGKSIEKARYLTRDLTLHMEIIIVVECAFA